MKIRELAQDHFIKKWVGLNLMGWFLGLFIGPILFDFIIIPNSPDFVFHVLDPLQPLITSFLFGISLGLMQQIMLRQWKVPSGIWILATAFGIGIPTTVISSLLNSGALGYSDWTLLAQIAEVFLMGLGIGGLQAILMRNKVSKVGSWMRAYVVGFPALGIVTATIVLAAVILAEPIEKLFYSLGLWELVYYRDGLLILSIEIVLPFFAAFFIGLPTGLLLQRSGEVETNNEDKSEEPPKAKLAIP